MLIREAQRLEEVMAGPSKTHSKQHPPKAVCARLESPMALSAMKHWTCNEKLFIIYLQKIYVLLNKLS